jgi:hypothetical protein
MTLFELLFVASWGSLTFFLSRPHGPDSGWWTLVPAIALAYGIVKLLYLGLGAFLDRFQRDVRPGRSFRARTKQ